MTFLGQIDGQEITAAAVLTQLIRGPPRRLSPPRRMPPPPPMWRRSPPRMRRRLFKSFHLYLFNIFNVLLCGPLKRNLLPPTDARPFFVPV